MGSSSLALARQATGAAAAGFKRGRLNAFAGSGMKSIESAAAGCRRSSQAIVSGQAMSVGVISRSSAWHFIIITEARPRHGGGSLGGKLREQGWRIEGVVSARGA